MFWKKQGKPEKQLDYDRENWRPVLKCSICNGERVAGFKNIRTGEFKEESFIRSDEELEAFKRRYGISEMKKEY
ncbi:aspartate dehydrogenase [bacterium D16-50]|nr:aspartate dehydrogenase [Lachnospiraceae bacterium]RKJ22403.1 aspartate dehydrogenase [bacterium D16-50]